MDGGGAYLLGTLAVVAYDLLGSLGEDLRGVGALVVQGRLLLVSEIKTVLSHVAVIVLCAKQVPCIKIKIPTAGELTMI